LCRVAYCQTTSGALQGNKGTVYEWVKPEDYSVLPSRAVCAVQFARSFGESKKEKPESL